MFDGVLRCPSPRLEHSGDGCCCCGASPNDLRLWAIWDRRMLTAERFFDSRCRYYVVVESVGKHMYSVVASTTATAVPKNVKLPS